MANKENVTMKFIKQISFQNATANREKNKRWPRQTGEKKCRIKIVKYCGVAEILRFTD